MYYSLFVFCFYYKIIGLSFLNLASRRQQAYPFLARWYGPGLGLKRAGQAGPGTNINGLDWAWA